MAPDLDSDNYSAHTHTPLTCDLRLSFIFRIHVHVSFEFDAIWKAFVDVPCYLQRVVINLQRVVDTNQ